MQRVRYSNALSDSLPVTAGIPEGSSFEPQLFNIYVNDLLRTLPADGCIAYADDITLIGKGSSPEDARKSLQSLIDIVTTWSHDNSLLLNISKCSSMFISSKLRSKSPVSVSPVVINDQSVAVVTEMTILGVIITSDLSRTMQADKVRSKINGHLAVLRRFGQLLNYRSRLKLFNAFIKPVLRYCLPVWGNCPVLCHRAIDRTLTRCVHFILHGNAALLSQRVFDDTFICTFNYLVIIANAFCV